MTAGVVLGLPELCDQITHFLDDPDRQACALVCPTLTSSAQHRLLREIDLSELGVHEAAACIRFCSVLEASPHLLPFVRPLQVTFSHKNAITQLSRMRFPNLQGVVFSTDFKVPSHVMQESLQDCSGAMADIIGLPSIRRVELRYPIFANMGDFSRLFELCTPDFQSLYLVRMSLQPLLLKLPATYHSALRALDPPLPVVAHPRREVSPSAPGDEAVPTPTRRTIKRLRLSSHKGHPLQDPLCPFDFSALEIFHCDFDFLYGADAVVIGPTITWLKINMPRSSSYLRPPPPIAPERLSGLKTLEAVALCRDLADVNMALTGLPPLPSLELLVLTLEMLDLTEPSDRLHHLSLIETAVAALTLSPLARIKIRVPRVSEPEDVSDLRSKIPSAFAALAANDQLKIIFVN
ncbi:hypothetical protein FB451DRAFT_1372286 [Mycena latifolia]|nr:hypothetical protein FB451DRAFT_1372286 [Mycena latifolia]